MDFPEPIDRLRQSGRVLVSVAIVLIGLTMVAAVGSHAAARVGVTSVPSEHG